jgi:ribosomal protein L27
VGNDGETLVADSSTSTGLRWQGDYAAGKNKIINGDMGVWQRGTTINTVSGADTFFADRFVGRGDSPSGTPVVTRQTFTPGTAPVAGYEGQYFLRYSTGGNVNMAISQKIEDVRTLAGQTITVSFWAKTSTAKTFTILVRQAFGTGGSADVDQSASYTTTTSWQRFTQTFTLGSLSGKTIGTNSFLLLQPVAYSAQTGNFDVDLWGVQVEAGNTATVFQTATGTIQGELAACQRYYYRAGGDNEYQLFGNGVAASTTQANIAVPLPSTLRISPSSIDTNNLGLYDGATVTAATVVVRQYSSKSLGNLNVSVASGLTAQRAYFLLANNSTSAYIGFNAEL